MPQSFPDLAFFCFLAIPLRESVSETVVFLPRVHEETASLPPSCFCPGTAPRSNGCVAQ